MDCGRRALGLDFDVRAVFVGQVAVWFPEDSAVRRLACPRHFLWLLHPGLVRLTAYEVDLALQV